MTINQYFDKKFWNSKKSTSNCVFVFFFLIYQVNIEMISCRYRVNITFFWRYQCDVNSIFLHIYIFLISFQYTESILIQFHIDIIFISHFLKKLSLLKWYHNDANLISFQINIFTISIWYTVLLSKRYYSNIIMILSRKLISPWYEFNIVIISIRHSLKT